MSRPRIAIAHDYLTQRGGAERVVLAMARTFPDAPIYTTLYNPDTTYPEYRDLDVRPGPLNRIGRLRNDHRFALPLLAPAVGRQTIDADITVVSSSGWAHGFPTTGRTLVYCYSPARWLYQTETYLGGPAHRSAQGLAIFALRPALKRWDLRRAQRADRYLAISRVVQDRIRETYGIDADVLAAPHTVDTTGPQESIDGVTEPGYYLVVSRLLPYKNVDKVIAAFAGMPKRLLVIGAGPLAAQLQESATPNVTLTSGLTDAQMRWAYANAKAVIAPSFEDFGLSPLEGGAYGIPTLALRAGGYLDTIAEGVNGAFFDEPTAAAISAAVRANASAHWDQDAIERHTQAFDEPTFAAKLRAYVDELR